MAQHEETGSYRALPQIGDQIAEFILQEEGGPGKEFGEALRDLGIALTRVDEELDSLSQANPNLERIVRGTVEGMYAVFSDVVRGEQNKAYLRAIAYINALVVLRTLDLQWRQKQPP